MKNLKFNSILYLAPFFSALLFFSLFIHKTYAVTLNFAGYVGTDGTDICTQNNQSGCNAFASMLNGAGTMISHTNQNETLQIVGLSDAGSTIFGSSSILNQPRTGIIWGLPDPASNITEVSYECTSGTYFATGISSYAGVGNSVSYSVPNIPSSDTCNVKVKIPSNPGGFSNTGPGCLGTPGSPCFVNMCQSNSCSAASQFPDGTYVPPGSANSCDVSADCSTTVNITATPSLGIPVTQNGVVNYTVTISSAGSFKGLSYTINCPGGFGGPVYCTLFQSDGTTLVPPCPSSGTPSECATYLGANFNQGRPSVGFTGYQNLSATKTYILKVWDQQNFLPSDGNPYPIDITATAGNLLQCFGPKCNDSKTVYYQDFVPVVNCENSISPAPNNGSGAFPFNYQCTNRTATSYTLNWNAAGWTGGVGSPEFTKIRVDRTESDVYTGCGTGACDFRLDNGSYNMSSYNVTGLSPATTYYNRVINTCTDSSGLIRYKDLPNYKTNYPNGLPSSWQCSTLACNPDSFNSGNSTIVAGQVSNGGPAGSHSATVAPGGDVTVSCDFGVNTTAASIAFPSGVVNCVWPGIVIGTRYVYYCKAPAAAGTVTVGCSISSVANDYFCPASGSAGTLTVANAPVNGVCGNRAGTFGSQAACQAFNTFCSAGTPTASPACPASGSVSWDCTGSNGGSTAFNCTTTITASPINGVCGTANGKTYPNGTSGYSPDNQCSTGSSSNTSFPSAGSSVSWTCSGQNGGSPSPSCSASQAPAGGTATIQGRKVNNLGNDFDPGATVTISGPSGTFTFGSGTNPFIANSLMAGTYTISSTQPAGYNVFYASIEDSIPFTLGNSFSTTVAANQTKNVRFMYAAVPPTGDIKCAPPAGVAQDACTITSGQAVNLTWTSLNATSCTVTPGGYNGTSNLAGQSSGALASNQIYTLNCTGPGGGPTNVDTVAVTVTGAPDFSISHSPASQTISQGASTAFTITLTSINGFSGAVNFAGVGNCPNNASCTFSPTNPVIPAGGSVSSTLIITSQPSAQTGNFTLGVTATDQSSGSLSHTTNPLLTINTAGSPPVLTLSASPNPVDYNTPTTLTWSAAGTGPITCNSTAGPWSVISGGASGSSPSSNLTASAAFTMSCTNAYGSDAKTVTVNVKPDSPDGGGGPTGSGGSSCGQINLSWTDVSNESGYYIYRNTTGTAPAGGGAGSGGYLASKGQNVVAHTDNPPTGSYYYWISAYNSYGESALVAFNNNPLGSSSCDAFVGVNKDITKVNNVSPPGYTPSSTGANETPPNTVYKLGDLVSFAVNLNNTALIGGSSATNVVITDRLTNLRKPSAGWGLKVNNITWQEDNNVDCSSPASAVASIAVNRYGVCGTAPNEIIYIKIGNITQGAAAKITFNGLIAVPSGFAQSTGRFQNTADVSYIKNSGGDKGQASASTPLIIFSISEAPTKHEIAP